MNTLSQVPDKIQVILSITADAAAVRIGFIKRSRKLTGRQFVLTHVLTWLNNPDATYTQFTHRWCPRHTYHPASH